VTNDPAAPRGIGGWLILPLLGLIITPFLVGFQLVGNIQIVFQPAIWKALTTPGSDIFHPLWAPLIIFEIAANAVMVAFGLIILWLFVKKSRRVPMLMIIWMVALAVVQVADLALARQIPAVAAEPDPQSMRDLFRSVLAAVIWVPYFLSSRRVKNTFVE
jgi:hypothetical protein